MDKTVTSQRYIVENPFSLSYISNLPRNTADEYATGCAHTAEKQAMGRNGPVSRLFPLK
jgi:hypothetical protein